jgi:arylsulfatase A-like enzyme
VHHHGSALEKTPSIHLYPPAVAWQRGDWKIHRPRTDAPLALFDLVQDPGETRDLAAEHPARVDAMAGELERWINACDADAR